MFVSTDQMRSARINPSPLRILHFNGAEPRLYAFGEINHNLSW